MMCLVFAYQNRYNHEKFISVHRSAIRANLNGMIAKINGFFYYLLRQLTVWMQVPW